MEIHEIGTFGIHTLENCQIHYLRDTSTIRNESLPVTGFLSFVTLQPTSSKKGYLERT